MSETKRKNADYTASAINLTNSEDTWRAYNLWKEAELALNKAELEIESKVPPELITARDEARKAVGDAYDKLKESIDKFGGIQEVQSGSYALKTEAKTPIYHAEPFIKNYEQYVPAVITQAVNPEALKGLIKGGLVEQAPLEAQGVITYKKTVRTIIK